MKPAAYRQLVEATVGRVAVCLGADGRKGRLVAVFTGASADFSRAVDQVRGLILDGYRLEIIFSDAAEALYGETLREMLGGFPQLAPVDEAHWITAADHAVAVVVLMLSLNTLSRITLLTADNRPTNIILRALFNGRPVVAAQNGVLPDLRHWRALAGATQPPALKAAVTQRLQTLATYGGRVVDVAQLRKSVAALDAKRTHRAVLPPVHMAAFPRRTLHLSSSIVTASQVRMAHAQKADLVLSDGAKITPLARELAQHHGGRCAYPPMNHPWPRRASPMIIAQIIGTVVATRKHDKLVGSKIHRLRSAGRLSCRCGRACGPGGMPAL
jgi:hypothetical protein